MVLAAFQLKEATPSATWENAKQSNAGQLTKSPYSQSMKIVKLSGVVYQIQQQAPIEGMMGDWYEILIAVDNPNSPFGTSTVDFIYIGDASSIEPKSKVVFAGYFAGLDQGENMFGGKVSTIVIVGNVAKPRGNASRTSGSPQPPSKGQSGIADPNSNRPAAHKSSPANQTKALPRPSGPSGADAASPVPPDWHRPSAQEIMQKLHN
jgi:hypothetical protein